MTSSENKERVRVVMIVASLPPLAAGGAEMQALRLGKALIAKGHTVCYVTPGKGKTSGTGEIDGMRVDRLKSIFNRIFAGVSAMKKKQQNVPRTRIEYDDRNEPTQQIVSRVGWPTVIYYHIFYYHSLLVLWRRRH